MRGVPSVAIVGNKTRAETGDRAEDRTAQRATERSAKRTDAGGAGTGGTPSAPPSWNSAADERDKGGLGTVHAAVAPDDPECRARNRRNVSPGCS